MAFSPRTSAPSYSDKWWIHTSKGGYNSCIEVDTANGSVLPNCFAGDTEFVTHEGIRTLKECVGQTVEVLTLNGWKSAIVKEYPATVLWEVSIGRDTYYTTANHRWPTYSQTLRFKEFTETQNLKPNMIILYTCSSPIEYPQNIDGIQHGFVYGDGCKGYKGKYTDALLCGNKREYMLPYFANKDKKYYYKDGTIDIPYCTSRGKEIPEPTEDPEYLYNFLSGYFAADGTVDKSGNTIEICSSKNDDLNKIRSLFAVLGIRTGDVVGSLTDGYTGLRLTYNLRIRTTCLTPAFFLNPIHRTRFESRLKPKVIKSSKVNYIKITDRVEPTYCLEEPDTHTFTLASGHLTGNCTGYAWGRFGEIMGSTPKLSRNAARRWFSVDANDGYQRGQTPQLGAVLCLYSSSFGHVAIVERINSDGSILTSESGYPTATEGTDKWNQQLKSKRFWTSTRRPPSYLTSSEKGYSFQGFIYNPACGQTNTEPEGIKLSNLDQVTSPTTSTKTSTVSESSATYISKPGSATQGGATYTGYNPNSREASIARQEGRIVSKTTKVESFVSYAENQLNAGSYATTTQSKAAGSSVNQGWSASFISSTAQATGTSSVIPTTTSCTNLITTGVKNDMGEWLPARVQDASLSNQTAQGIQSADQNEYKGTTVQPSAGDIAFFRTNNVKSTTNKYQADYCGIVTQVSDNTMTVIQGNVSGEVKQKVYDIDNQTIVGYYRPNWSSLDSDAELSIAYRNKTNVIAGLSSMQDATLKEVGYFDSTYKPSISPSGLKLEVINYTGFVGEVETVFDEVLEPESGPLDQPNTIQTYEVASQETQPISTVAFDGLTSAERTVITYLINKGLNPAIACGICANIKAESNFRTGAKGDKNTSFGICQWHKGRGEAMKNMVGEGWENNLSGQLDYLWSELCGSYKFVLNSLSGCPNTVEGAKQAADIFVRKFEVPSNVDAASTKRQISAAEYYNKIIIQL